MLHSTRRSLIWSTSLAVLVAVAVELSCIVPFPEYSVRIGEKETPSTNGFLCLIVGSLTWCLFPPVAPSFHTWERWFLDTACICQTDEQLKQEGIRALGTFLDRSDTMVLLLSPAYFERGWCTFEVATFLAHHNIKSVEIVPLLRAKMSALNFALSLIEVAGFHVVNYLGLPWGLQTLAAKWSFAVSCVVTGMQLGGAFWLLERYLRQQQEILQKVANFTFAGAKFTDEADRAFVGRSIEALFGSIGNFESEVRSSVYQKIVGELGSSRQPVPYMIILVGVLPWFWWGVDMVSTDSWVFLSVDVLFSTSMAFCLFPLLTAMLGSMAKLKLAYMPEPGSWRLDAAATALAALAALPVCTASIFGTVHVYWHEGLPFKLALWAAWFLVTLACYLQQSWDTSYKPLST